jgi:hypothetical protein
MNPQPDKWTKRLPDGRTVVYTSDIGLKRVGGPITAQVEGNVIKHTDLATHEMNQQEIEAAFAGILAK